MSRSMQVLSVLHRLQGLRFKGYVQEPSYERLVNCLMRQADFVFEEAAGRLPSVAQILADKILGSGHYLDVDPPPDERQQYGIAEKTGEDFPIDPSQLCSDVTPDVCHCAFVNEHRKREELWLQKIQAQSFGRSLMVCGSAHGLSLAFRLESAGLSEVRLYEYIPYNKVCAHRMQGQS
ncbi:MAG TPA: hypothetical protein VNF02_00125 [Candidatus Limnocylindrales bacterium]|nr:hypothetical protein [Candidatus Limnocylindrales bacterium]